MLHGHGDDIYKYRNGLKANFSSNVMPYGVNEKLITFIQKNIKNISNYPEPLAETLNSAIAKKNNLSDKNVLATNGATEAFYLIAELFWGKKSTILVPSFAEYEDACKKYSHQITLLENKNELAKAEINTNLVWLCNPNNPDGKLYNSTIITNLANQNKKTIFIVDEAYINFTIDTKSLLTNWANTENIIVIHSLTKQYVIPGLRLGYVVAHENIILKLKELLMPWRIGTLTIELGKFLMSQNDNHFNELLNELLKNSFDLQKRINSLENFKVIPSKTNYFLVECKCKASEIKKYLLEKHGLLIRDASNFKSLSNNIIRISTQTEEKNNLLAKALQKWTTT